MKIFSKKVAALAICTTLTTLSFGQNNEINYDNKVVGKYESSNKDIIAHRIIFPGKVGKIYFDSSSNNLTSQVYGTSNGNKWNDKGLTAILYDLKGDSALWAKENYGFLDQEGDIIIQTKKTESHRVENTNGKDGVLLQNQISFIDAKNRTGLGFVPYKHKTPSELVGVNLDNGNIKWRKKIPRNFPNYIPSYLNDSTVLVMGAGLHAINLNTGEGWDYNTTTGDKGYNDVDPGEPSRFCGIAGGTYSRYNATGLFLGVSSNVIIDTNYCYFASKEKLAKLDRKNGQAQWSYNFKDNEASSSILFSTNDSVLYMYNIGFAVKNNKWIKFGNPFLAAFDKKTGQKIYQTPIADKENVSVQISYRLSPLYILYKHKIATYDLANGNFIKQNAVSSESVDDENLTFCSSEIYINKGDSLMPNFQLIDSTKQCVVTNEHHFLEFEKDLTFKKGDTAPLYQVKAKKNLHIIIHREFDDNMFILDKSGKVIVRFKAPSASQLIGDKLYGVEDKIVTIVDLSDILK